MYIFPNRPGVVQVGPGCLPFFCGQGDRRSIVLWATHAARNYFRSGMNARLTHDDFAWKNVWRRRAGVCLTLRGAGAETRAVAQKTFNIITMRRSAGPAPLTSSTTLAITSIVRNTVVMSGLRNAKPGHACFHSYQSQAQGEK
jgi:hypothetical protein